MWRLWLTSVVLLAVRQKLVEAQGLDFFSIFIGVGIATAAHKYYSSIDFGSYENCTDFYINLDHEGLKNDLNHKLHGQHLVSETLLKSVTAHFKDPNPQKPLVLSFHGLYGVGKNFAARILIENIYKKKEDSLSVHLFNPETEFEYSENTDTLKYKLRKWFKYRTSFACERSLFIFDAMDHMSEGVIDVMATFFDYTYQPPSGFRFRKFIFIFLSNTGGSEIEKIALKAWENGENRESIQLRDVQEVLASSAYNEKGGLKNSKLVQKSLIDHFIPFLPLERSHVRKCVHDELKRQNMSNPNKDDIEKVLDELIWYPKDLKVYSISGCKKVAQKVALLDLDKQREVD